MFKEAVFTVFDFETTGLFPYSGDRICEIGAVKMISGKRIKKFHSMVNPERQISPGAYYVNRITPRMLKGAPKINEILPDFLEFIQHTVLVSYNAGFDIGFLETSLGEDKDILKDYCVIDALTLARRLYPDLGRYNLASVVRGLGIKPLNEHRAISDAMMTAKIFQKMLDMFTTKGMKTVRDILDIAPRKPKTIRTVIDARMEIIKNAIKEERKLELTYASPWKNEITKRLVTPLDLQQGYDKMYLVAFCHLRNEERNFRFDGILKIEPVDQG